MTIATAPVSTTEIMTFIPHRPPMVWIDKVLSYQNDEGECTILLKPDGLYMDDRGLRPSACLEFIAQAYGYISVCYHLYVLDPKSKPLKKAFLASIKDAPLPRAEVLSSVKVGAELRIKITFQRQLGPIVMFKGEVFNEETKICEAQMKVFKES